MTPITALLVSHDDALIDTALRCAAAYGVDVELSADAGAALPRWGAVAAVLVGSDQLPHVAALRPPRRSGVVVLAPGSASESDFRVAMEIGAGHVAELPMAEEWLIEFLGDLADLGAHSGAVWGFVGGSGGVGSTTLACAVAVIAARDRNVALLDLDEQGPGIDVLLGGDDEVGVRWSDLHAAPGRFAARSLRDALPRWSGVGVLTFDRDASGLDATVVREALSAARRGHDLVVVDLPRWLGGAPGAALVSCNQVVVTAASSVGGVGSARRVLSQLGAEVPPELVVRTTGRGADPGDVATALGRGVSAGPVIELTHDRGLEEQIDLGLGPVARRRSPVNRAARALLDRLSGAGQ